MPSGNHSDSNQILDELKQAQDTRFDPITYVHFYFAYYHFFSVLRLWMMYTLLCIIWLISLFTINRAGNFNFCQYFTSIGSLIVIISMIINCVFLVRDHKFAYIQFQNWLSRLSLLPLCLAPLIIVIIFIGYFLGGVDRIDLNIFLLVPVLFDFELILQHYCHQYPVVVLAALVYCSSCFIFETAKVEAVEIEPYVQIIDAINGLFVFGSFIPFTYVYVKKAQL